LVCEDTKVGVAVPGVTDNEARLLSDETSTVKVAKFDVVDRVSPLRVLVTTTLYRYPFCPRDIFVSDKED
jgi:hypothetical protein